MILFCAKDIKKYDGSYVLGTLLLGNADLRTKEKELKEELKPYLSDIRVISMNESGCDGKASEEFLEFLGSRKNI